MVFSGVVGVWLVVAFAFLLAVDRSRSWSSVRVRCRPFVFVVVRSCSLSSVRVRCRPFVFVVIRSCSLSSVGVHVHSFSSSSVGAIKVVKREVVGVFICHGW
jgi:hypothetical protein